MENEKRVQKTTMMARLLFPALNFSCNIFRSSITSTMSIENDNKIKAIKTKLTAMDLRGIFTLHNFKVFNFFFGKGGWDECLVGA